MVRAGAVPGNKEAPALGGKYCRDEVLELINSHYLIGKSEQEVSIFRVRGF